MSSAAPVIELRRVTKRFSEVTACEAVSLCLRPGEVHCLLGENGAGKSTLIALLTGLQQPSEGVIEIDGVATTLGSPAAAIARGIGVVQQHSMLVPTMTVAENLMLAGDAGGWWLDRAGAEQRLEELGRQLGATIEPGTLVEQLGLGQRQQLEIILALRRRPRVLILDEPTSMLSPQAARALAHSIRQETRRGVSVLLVTHRLQEALAVGDRVTVLRRGRVAATLPPEELHAPSDGTIAARILDAMFGGSGGSHVSDGTAVGALQPYPSRPQATGSLDSPVVLSLERVSTDGTGTASALDRVSLHLRAGEVLGIAGIDGHGQKHLAEVIAGQRRASAGQARFEGVAIDGMSVRERGRLGLRYLTDDRLHEGIIASFSVAVNLLLKRVGERPFWRFARMDRSAVRAEGSRLISDYDIRARDAETRAGELSGGNIQKLLLARELSGAPRAVVFHKPSYGLDPGTVHRVHREIREFAAGGGSVLLISADLDELVALSHRIAVMRRGGIVAEIENRGDERVRDELAEHLAEARAGAAGAA